MLENHGKYRILDNNLWGLKGYIGSIILEAVFVWGGREAPFIDYVKIWSLRHHCIPVK